MAVYVDDMWKYPLGYFRGMKMSHMVADSTEELLAMADRIGVQRKWIQNPGTTREHFDICYSKRLRAVAFGAVEISMRELAGRPWSVPGPPIAKAKVSESLDFTQENDEK